MKIEPLDGLKDAELQEVVARAQQLLEERGRKRKQEALEQARAVLEAAGLTVDDLRQGARKAAKAGTTYLAGTKYQHPDDPAKVWAGKGKKPHWLGDLERRGVKPVEAK